MRFRIMVALAALGMLALTAVAGANVTAAGPTVAAGGQADLCFLLPDPKSSVRWETQDRPAFEAAAKKAKISYVITNADGDPQKQRSQADQCLANGAKVVVLVSLDFGSSLAIEKAAKARNAKVIEYDRQVVGGVGDIYISFDGRRVGVLQGTGVVRGLKANGKYSKKPVVARLNGGPTDNNSYLFKGGYDSVLRSYYKNGTFKKGPDQFTPDWDNQKAQTIFEQMLVQTNNNIQGAVAANDNIAGAVVATLKAKGLKPIALSGQDATVQGVQNIISGWQTNTVYKYVPAESDAAIAAAVALYKGKKPPSNSTRPNGKKRQPTMVIPVVSITKANYTRLFRDRFLKRSEVCSGEYKQYCR